MNSIKREQVTRKKAIEFLEKHGWDVWFPMRPSRRMTKYPKNSGTDIFNLWDLVAVRELGIKKKDVGIVNVRFIQLKTNHTGKIDEKYFKHCNIKGARWEYWSYNTKKREWTRVQLEKGKNYLKDYAKVS